MKPWFVALFVIAAIVFFGKKYKKSHLQNVSVSLYSLRGPLADYKVDQGPQIDKCFIGHKNCILIYVAPWCPACHSFIQQHATISSILEQKGIASLMIVGADDNRGKEIAFKEELGERAILDTVQGDFRKRNSVNSFPFFVMSDPSGHVVATGSDVINRINEVLNQK